MKPASALDKIMGSVNSNTHEHTHMHTHAPVRAHSTFEHKQDYLKSLEAAGTGRTAKRETVCAYTFVNECVRCGCVRMGGCVRASVNVRVCKSVCVYVSVLVPLC